MRQIFIDGGQFVVILQDLVLLPLVLRALFGEKLKQLRAEIGPHVTRSIAFFLAACGHGGVT